MNWRKQAEREPHINRCNECDDVINTFPDGRWRRSVLAPLRCWSCVDEMENDGTLDREGYTRREARWVL